MKKSAFLVASGVASVLGLGATPAFSQGLDYLGAGVAVSDVDKYDNGTVLIINGGTELRALPGLSIEGEATGTIDNPNSFVGDLSYWTAGAYASYRLPLGEQFAVRGRLGGIYEDLNYDNVPGAPSDSNGFQFSGGVGADFNVTRRFAVTADYTQIDPDIAHYGIGVKFNF